MELLPVKHRILAACRGEVNDDHPLLVCAAGLSRVHRQLLTLDANARNEFERLRAELIREIDEWVARRLPPSLGCARLHTESLGAVIDRLAGFTACAHAALADTDEWELRQAWHRLAELAIGYDDLTDELSAGRRRLPGGR